MKATQPESQAANHEGSRRPQSFWLFGSLAVWLCAVAAADSITFTTSTIPFRDCTIQAVHGGQVHYLDNRGQRQRRELEQIRALGFDGLVELDEAERALAADNTENALAFLLGAMTKARTTLQRLWIHARLAHVHGAGGEYVQAAGHAAAAMAADDPHWRGLVPEFPVGETASLPAVREALDHIQSAMRKVSHADLKHALEQMLWEIQPLHDRLMKEHGAASLTPGGTISGIPKSEIPKLMEAAAREAPHAPAVNHGEPAAPQVAATTSAANPQADAEPDSPAGIDALLAAQRWGEALGACRRVERDPGERDLARFLFQYGTALDRSGQRADAAVMFARCAVLFPESADAVHSLIQTAIIYRDHYRQLHTARGLLQQAADAAAANHHDAAGMLARELLGSL